MDGSCNVFLQIAHESNEVDHDHTATAFHFLTSIFLLVVVDGVVAVVVGATALSVSMASSETISILSIVLLCAFFEVSFLSRTQQQTTFQNLGFYKNPKQLFFDTRWKKKDFSRDERFTIL